MICFKVYSTNSSLLEQVASSYGADLDFLKEGVGAGYVCSVFKGTKTLRIFIKGSHVDLDETIEDVTGEFVRNYSKFVL